MPEYGVRIKGLRSLTKLFDVLIRDMSTVKVMSRMGNYVMHEIKDRTGKGVDVTGSPFDEYSAGHSKIRAMKGLPTSIVDLFFHGTMMNAMSVDASDDEVRIFFLPTAGKNARGRPANIKSPEKAYYLNEQREFFALSAQDQKEIAEIAIEEVDKIFQQTKGKGKGAD